MTKSQFVGWLQDKDGRYQIHCKCGYIFEIEDKNSYACDNCGVRYWPCSIDLIKHFGNDKNFVVMSTSPVPRNLPLREIYKGQRPPKKKEVL